MARTTFQRLAATYPPVCLADGTYAIELHRLAPTDRQLLHPQQAGLRQHPTLGAIVVEL